MCFLSSNLQVGLQSTCPGRGLFHPKGWRGTFCQALLQCPSACLVWEMAHASSKAPRGSLHPHPGEWGHANAQGHRQFRSLLAIFGNAFLIFLPGFRIKGADVEPDISFRASCTRTGPRAPVGLGLAEHTHLGTNAIGAQTEKSTGRCFWKRRHRQSSGRGWRGGLGRLTLLSCWRGPWTPRPWTWAFPGDAMPRPWMEPSCA